MITSTGNTQIKNVINLIKKSGERRTHGLFVIEGIRMFEETPRNRIERIFASESFIKKNGDLLEGLSYEAVSDKVYAYMSDTKSPQGIMAVVRMADTTLDDMLAGEGKKLFVVLENLQDPGNLGTIIRTAEGAGATGIIMSRDTVDVYNPKVIRSTMGALYRVPFVYVEDILNATKILNARNIATYAAHLDGAVVYTEADYTGDSAILIGNEGNGLTDGLAALATNRIIIPMGGMLESLNAAVATAVILYEAARQRR